MINVSNEFWKTMQERTDFKENAVITFKDGAVLELDESVFATDNNFVTDAAGVNSIPLGVALSRSIQIELQNDDKRFSTYDFFGATIRLYLTFQLSESVERIEYGTFTVVSPATYGETVIITANDDMYKANESYSTNITFPAQAWEVLQDSCATCGISLSTTEFLNNDFEIQEMPSSDCTHQQIIGYIAMIACGNARINRQGYLEILSYDFSFLNEVADGGTFNPWTGGYVADGGTFDPWTDGDVLDGGLFTDKKDYHILYNFKDSPRVDTDDVVITGVQTTIQSVDMQSKTVLLGQEGYVLKIDNPLIGGNEEDALQRIGAVMIDGRMRRFEGDHIAYPIAEFMDKAFVVDRNGNTYGTILTDINFTFFGFTTFKNSAENAVRNASSFGSQGTRAIITAQQMVKAERTARELAVEKLAQSLAASSGMYVTEEVQEDKSVIYYMHNKKTLAESDIVWKLTAQALGISTDGGETYPYGLDATGVAILERIYAIGIDANYIVTGMLKDKTGKSYWDLIKGLLHINGTFSQETSKGVKSVEIKDNQVKVYAWNDNGNYVGSIGSLYSESEDINSIALWSEYGDRVLIGYNALDDSNTKKAVIRFDPEDIENGNPPWIRNTMSGTIFSGHTMGIKVKNGFIVDWDLDGTDGTIFPDNPGGGIVVKNGLITGWSMNGSTANLFSGHSGGGVKIKNGLICGWDLDSMSGTIFSSHSTGIQVKNGLITNWGLDGASGTLFSTNPGGGVTIKQGLITGWDLDVAGGTLSVITGLSWNSSGITSISRADIVIKGGLIVDWTTSTKNY